MSLASPGGPERLPLSANLKGIIAMVAAMASFSVGDTIMKLVSATDMPTSELIFVRGSVVLSAAIFIMIVWGGLEHIRQALSWAMALRAGGDVGGGWFFQSGLARMPLADLMSVIQLTPLSITAASAVFLGEKVGWRRWTATGVGLVGVLLIIRPGSSAFNWWALAGIASVLCATVRDLATRQVDRRVPATMIMMLSALAVVLTSGAVAPFANWSRPDAGSLALLACAAVCSLIGQLCVIIAMRTGEVSAVAPFRYAIIVFSLISSFLVWGYFPDRLTLAGIAIVAAAGLYTFRREQHLARLRRMKELSESHGSPADRGAA
ncbi:MAG TPA: DMT family transporter [Hyphomicrobiaceae bacterium]|nr:DMT family transporter [Hyphomicrobiaceae bacterium]